MNAKPELVYRSVYEKKEDLIYDINQPSEGGLEYSIVEGNENGHYTINEKNGEIRIDSPIEDTFGVVHTDLLKVKAGVREDLRVFPFQVKRIKRLTLDFDFRKIYGDDSFKIALNLFTFEESGLTNLYNSDGDFFFIFDQAGNYIPPYPYSLPDIKISGKAFYLRYNNEKKVDPIKEEEYL